MMALSSPADVALGSFAVAGRNRLDQGTSSAALWRQQPVKFGISRPK